MKRFTFIFLVPVVLCLSNCKKSESTTEEASEDTVSNIVESAMAEASSQGSAIVTAGFFDTEDFDSPIHSIQPRAACSYTSARSSCSSTSATVDWGGCSLGTATLAGTITESFSGFGAAVCQLNGSNSVLTRVISSGNPRVLTFASGAKLTTTMQPSTAWDGTTFPTASTGTTISRLESGTSNGQSCANVSACYNIVVNGISNVLKGPSGRTWFDHIITSNITAKGAKASNDFVVTGSATVWHQLASYKAAHTFNSVTWGSSSCCYPTSGSITSTLTGSVSGSATLAFTSTCGTATYTGTDNVSRSLTLTQCNL